MHMLPAWRAHLFLAGSLVRDRLIVKRGHLREVLSLFRVRSEPAGRSLEPGQCLGQGLTQELGNRERHGNQTITY